MNRHHLAMTSSLSFFSARFFSPKLCRAHQQNTNIRVELFFYEMTKKAAGSWQELMPSVSDGRSCILIFHARLFKKVSATLASKREKSGKLHIRNWKNTCCRNHPLFSRYFLGTGGIFSHRSKIREKISRYFPGNQACNVPSWCWHCNAICHILKLQN